MRSNPFLRGAAVFTLALCSSRLFAQTPATQPQEPSATEAEEERIEVPFDFLENTRLTGDGWGARKWLEDKGIEFNLSMTAIYQQNFHGGLDTHNGHDFTGSVDTELTLDFEKMGLWKGGILYVLGESSWNDDIGFDKVGSLHGVNGDAYLGDEPIQVSELWYQQTFLDEKVRVKVGKMDLRLDFDLNAYANDETYQFLNIDLVNIPNIPWPDYCQGVMLALQPFDWMYVQGAIADAQADGRETGFNTFYHDKDYTFTIFETGFTPAWNTSWGQLPGGYRFMLWYDPQPKPVFLATEHVVRNKTDDVGFAFNMDQMLLKEKPENDEDAQGLGMFFRYAYAHDDVNFIEHFWSVGGQYQGLIPTRDNDVLAFGFVQSIMGDRARRLDLGDRESIYEVYYNIAVFPWIQISPDFQYVQQPGGSKAIPDSFVAGVRVQMSF